MKRQVTLTGTEANITIEALNRFADCYSNGSKRKEAAINAIAAIEGAFGVSPNNLIRREVSQ